MEERKNNTGLVVLTTVLVMLVLGMGAFIIYDKVINKTNEPNSEENNKVDNNDSNNITEYDYADINKTLNNNLSNFINFNDFDEAESKFREALRGEINNESNLGQAINYANIGAVFQKRQQYDSAYYYYNLSMLKNQLIGSQLGVGLCYKHFGEILEAQNENIKAEKEYRSAFSALDGMDDIWHWLEACISIARINLLSIRF